MSRFPGIPGQPQPTPGVNYNSLTLEDKEKYVMIISRLLGLRADATIERITPAVAKKVDEVSRRGCKMHQKDSRE